ncbi:MAG TPA: transcriptional regulator [Planctomycetes bacterium]|nr:transcriptional regulator [Planctomycetota bacterium]
MSTERGYKMRTVCELTGLSPALLRAWERRHGLLQPERTAGGHRLYTDDDLKVLRSVQEHMERGLSIGEIAVMGRRSLLAAVRPSPPGVQDAGGLAQCRARLVQAAIDIDASQVEEVLDQAFGMASPITAIDAVLAPALDEIGEQWANGRLSVAGEHLVSAKVITRIRRLLEATNQGPGRPAVVTCLPDELHEIGALLAAYALCLSGFRVSYLGAAMPLEDLERACVRIRPAVVSISSVRTPILQTHLPRLAELVARRQEVRFLVGGRGAVPLADELGEHGLEYFSTGSFKELVDGLSELVG